MVRWTTIGLWLGISAAIAGCGDDDTDPMVDSGMDEDSGTGVDAGQDAGTRPDSGMRDAGVACTSGCAIEEIVTGVDHVCGRRENGEVLCWGGNGVGQLGDGRERGHDDCSTRGVDDAAGYDCSATPVVVSGVTATSLASNAALQTCAITEEGSVCWGFEDVAASGSDPAESASRRSSSRSSRLLRSFRLRETSSARVSRTARRCAAARTSRVSCFKKATIRAAWP